MTAFAGASASITLRVCVSGSFTAAIHDVQRAVAEFHDAGVVVLSPSSPRPVDAFGDFVFVESDNLRTVRILQERHFEAIARSDLLWLCSPAGYLGDSAAAEVHHAKIHGVPIYCDTVPTSLYWRQVVNPVAHPRAALQHLVAHRAAQQLSGRGTTSLLLDPHAVTESLHRDVDTIYLHLTNKNSPVEDDVVLRAALWRLRGAS